MGGTMSIAKDSRRPVHGTGRALRALALSTAAGALLAGRHAGADPAQTEWFGSPVSGTIYRVVNDPATRTKSLVAPDGEVFPTTAAVIEAEAKARSPLQLRVTADLLEAASDPERADELIDVTLLLRRQPLYDAGVAARERVNPKLDAEFAR